MGKYPYTVKTRSLPKFFEHIQKAGVPPKVTQDYLKASGFKSGNDTMLIPILKFIQFLDPSGIPTERWHSYRDTNRAGGVLASAIRTAYTDLFQMYPDAHVKDDQTLRNFFGTRTKVAESTISVMVETFKILCQLADFEAPRVETIEEKPIPSPEVPTPPTPSMGITTVNLNIQLTLPPTTDPQVYDNLFAALKKHFPSLGR